jgi:para-nitrobenzyl esterase
MNNLPQSRFAFLILIGCIACSPESTPSEVETPSSSVQTGLEINIQSGPIQGTIIENTRVFYGIPYAEDASGTNRFKRPIPVAPWTAMHDATQPAPACAQPILGAPTKMETIEENCLHLDVWAPQDIPEQPLPVMVWLHGGGFGYGKTENYPGHVLVQNDVIVIMASYRLGPLGFLTYPSTDSEDGFTGNAAIHDQRLALEWVRDNAAVFGGDPNNVTLFGQSAGATSICQHIVSNESSGLFHKAIMQSGACESLVMTYDDSLVQGEAAARAVGCDTATNVIECLQNVSAEELVLARPTQEDVDAGLRRFTWGPVSGSAPLADWPPSMLESGNFNKVPVLLGTNKDDGIFFAFVRGLIGLDEDEYPDAIIGESSEEEAEQVAELYPIQNPAQPAMAIANLLGDKLFNCPMGVDARSIDAHGVDVYRYYFTQPIESGFLASYGTAHGAEMPFIFGAAVEDSYFLGENDAELSEKIIGYWTRFARTGNPNTAESFAWESFKSDTQSYLTLENDMRIQTDLRKDYCSFWDNR